MSRSTQFTGSLLARLILGYVLVATVFAAAWLWSLYGPLTRAAVSQQQRNLTAVAQSAALAASESTSTADELARRLVARTDLRLTIVAADGTVLADSNFAPEAMENHANRPEIARALEGEIGVDRRVSRTEGVEELYVAAPTALDGARVALRVSQPLAEIEAIAARSRRAGLMLLAVSLAVAVVIAVRVTREISRPIAGLSVAAERMAAGDLSAEIPPVPTDMETLASALGDLKTQMRARIEALQGEERTLRATLDGLTDAVLLFEGETIELANSAADRVLGTPRGGWKGCVLGDVALPAGLEMAIRKHASGDEPVAIDLEPDPTGRALHAVIAPVDGTGAAGRTIVAITDVTERSRLDRVRRDFVANASHELKTPAAGIRLLAQSAESAADDGDLDQAMAFARQIEAESERLQRLVGDLLDLSRLESPPSASTIADVRKAVDNATMSHGAAANRKGLSLRVDGSAVRDRDVFVAADPTDLAIALDNLLDNAIGYSESGSVVVRLETDDQFVRIAVTDTGPGIAPEHQPRVFERFYRVDRGRSRETGGTGLGLALVRHVVERAGGSVELQSVPGEGSTFTLVLPRAR